MKSAVKPLVVDVSTQRQKLREIIIDVFQEQGELPTLTRIVDQIITTGSIRQFLELELDQQLELKSFMPGEIRQKIQANVINIITSNSAIFITTGYCYIKMSQVLPEVKNNNTMYLVQTEPGLIRINYFDFVNKQWKYIDQTEVELKEKGINLEHIQELGSTDNQDYINAITLMCDGSEKTLVIHLFGYPKPKKTYSSSIADTSSSGHIMGSSSSSSVVPLLQSIEEGLHQGTAITPQYTSARVQQNNFYSKYTGMPAVRSIRRTKIEFIPFLIRIIIAHHMLENRLARAQTEGFLKIKISQLIAILLDKYRDELIKLGFRKRVFAGDFIRLIKNIGEITNQYNATFFLILPKEFDSKDQELHVSVYNKTVASILKEYSFDTEVVPQQFLTMSYREVLPAAKDIRTNKIQFIPLLTRIIIAHHMLENRLVIAKTEGFLKIKISQLAAILLDKYRDELIKLGFTKRVFAGDFIRFIKQIGEIDRNFDETFVLDSPKEFGSKDQELHVSLQNQIVASMLKECCLDEELVQPNPYTRNAMLHSRQLKPAPAFVPGLELASLSKSSDLDQDSADLDLEEIYKEIAVQNSQSCTMPMV